MDHHPKNDESPLCSYSLDDDSTSNRVFAFLGEWAILLLTCSIALFFIPLTPSFTLNSTSSSVLNLSRDSHVTTNLGLQFLVDESNLIGSTIHYDSLHVSLFHRQEILSTFFSNEPSAKNGIQVTFPNVTVTVDEWGVDGTRCGFVHVDFWFIVNARYTQPVLPVLKDKVEGYCREVKVELCSSAAETTVVHPVLASCDVYSGVVRQVRLVLLVLLVVVLGIAATVRIVEFEHFFLLFHVFLIFDRFSYFTNSLTL